MLQIFVPKNVLIYSDLCVVWMTKRSLPFREFQSPSIVICQFCRLSNLWHLSVFSFASRLLFHSIFVIVKFNFFRKFLIIIKIILYVMPLCFARFNASVTSSIPVSCQRNFTVSICNIDHVLQGSITCLLKFNNGILLSQYQAHICA